MLVVGESVADIVRRPGRPDVPHPGGSPANVAYGLARLGHGTVLLTELGDDPMGELIAAHLASAGVRVLNAARAGTRTPTAVVSLDGDGKASYAFDIAWTLSDPALQDVTPQDPALQDATPQDPTPQDGGPGRAPTHVHLGSIAAVMEPGADAAVRAIESLGGRATVSYDPNVRPALMGERLAALRRVERCVAAADVVKASDEDLAWLYPDEPEAAVAARWLGLRHAGRGPALVLVTRGAAGAAGYTDAGTVAVPAGPATVVDTVGAGDSFMAAVLHALLARGVIGTPVTPVTPGTPTTPGTRGTLGAPERGRPAPLATSELAEVLRQAVTAAAVTVSRAGANPPDSRELESALQAP